MWPFSRDDSQLIKELQGINQRLNGIETHLANFTSELANVTSELANVTSEVAALRTNISEIDRHIAILSADYKNMSSNMAKVYSTLEELSSDLGRTAESTIRANLQQSHSVSFPNSYDVYDLESLIRLLKPRYDNAAEIDEDYLTVAKCMVVGLSFIPLIPHVV
jgi:uncharacterized coiled-coil DUF342 family protein